MTTKKILVSTSSFGENDITPIKKLKQLGYKIIYNPFKRKLTNDELKAILDRHNIFAIIAGVEEYNEEILKKYSIKIISRLGSGISNIDLKTAKKLRIKVLNTPDAPTDAVAEMTIGMMITLLRKSIESNINLKKGKWERFHGNLLKEKNILIIGYGNIGKRVHHYLKNFDANILIYDPFKKSKKIDIQTNLNNVLKKADIITCHASGNKEIIGKNEFKKIKKGSILLNCSRGSLISEKYLIESIKNQSISSAWLDVFNTEPYKGELLNYKNVIVTPHISSYTEETRIKMENDAVINLINNI